MAQKIRTTQQPAGKLSEWTWPINPKAIAEIRQRLQDRGMRATIARVRALLVLEQARKPMTIQEMFEQSPDSLNNRSTVLRVVRDLQDGGLCSISEIDGVEIIEALRTAT